MVRARSVLVPGIMILAVVSISCGRGKPAERQAGSPDAAHAIPAGADPESLFTALEARLLGASFVDVRYDIASDGLIPSAVSGVMAVASGNRARLSPSGTFGGNPFDYSFVSDGATMQVLSDTATVSAAAPPFLNEAILIGFTRMGHLHNLAVLSEGAPPDHAEGGVKDWVQVVNFASVDSIPAPDPAWVTVAFDILVGGRNAAHGVLWLDPVTGLPAARDQVVRFPGGEMRARERYAAFAVDGTPAPEVFELSH